MINDFSIKLNIVNIMLNLLEFYSILIQKETINFLYLTIIQACTNVNCSLPLKSKRKQILTCKDVTPSLLKVLLISSLFIYFHKKTPKHKVIYKNNARY